MSRPLYESSQQAARERAIVSELCVSWKCNAKKLPIHYHLDYVLVRSDTAIAFAEVKSKYSKTLAEVNDLGGYLVNLSKIERAANFQRLTGLPFALIVEFKDGVHVAIIRDIGSMRYLTVVRGRMDRGDWQDVEPALIIATCLFSKTGISAMEEAA